MRRLQRTLSPKGSLAAGLLVTLLLGFVGDPSSAAVGAQDITLYREDFSTGAAEGWYLSSKWEVVQEPDGNYVLRGRGGGAHYAQDAWGDSTLSLRLKISRGRFGLLFRRSGCAQYRVEFYPDDSEINLGKNSTCDPQSELARTAQRLVADQWYAVRIDARAGRIAVWVDGKKVLSFNDPSPLAFGMMTFESNGDNPECAVDDILLQGPGSSPAGTLWIRTGGPPGGMGYDVRIDPRNPSIIYVTCAFAGLHKSVDGGDSWVPMNEGIMSHAGSSGHAIPVFCATIDPSNSDILWVGTLQAKGIYRSTDGGAHWELRVNGVSSFPPDHPPTVRGFAVDPRDSQVVFAALEIQNPERGYSYGQIYRTSDSGEHWSLVLEANNLFRRIEIDPQNPDVIYAGTGIFDRQGAFEGVFKSTDGGRTWAKINIGLANLIAPYLALSPEDSNVIYAATGREYGFGGMDDGGVFASRDAGAHWEKVLTPSYGVVGAVAVAPSDAGRVYAAIEEHFYRSADGGVTWEDLGFNLPGFKMGPPIAIDVDPVNPDVVYLNGYGGGIYRSSDGGTSWQSANKGYTGAHVLDIVVDPQDGGRIYVTAANCGVFRSDDAGDSYQGLLPKDIMFGVPRVTAVDPEDSRIIYTGDGGKNLLFKSNDAGRTWARLGRIGPEFDAAIAKKGPGAVITELLVSPQDGNVLYLSATVGSPLKPYELAAGTGLGVYKSVNGGATWQAVNDGLSSLQVLSLSLGPTNPDVLYAGTFGGGVCKSSDGGASWVAVNSGLPSLEIRALAIDSRNPATILAGPSRAGVYKSTDGGLHWRWTGVGMDAEANVRAMVFNPLDSSEVYAATLGGGVFRSADGGETWQGFNWGLRNRAIHTLAISSDGKLLYAGTEGEGVYRFSLR